MFKFHNESGRSMVEMLGTLAIMGVLTVGGISGYTTAMNNHKANEALNDAKRLAMMISSERMLGKTGVLDAKEYEQGLYTFTPGDDQGKIVLTVRNIPSGVANKLNKMKDDLQIADIIIADNNVTFEFMNDLSGKPSVVGTDQNQGGQGQSGQQETENNNPCTGKAEGDSCGGIKTCQSGVCQVDNGIWYQGGCASGYTEVWMTDDGSGISGVCVMSESEAREACASNYSGAFDTLCDTGIELLVGTDIEHIYSDGRMKWYYCQPVHDGC